MIMIEILSHWNQQENCHGLQQDKDFIPVLAIAFIFPHKQAYLLSSSIFFYIPSARDESTVRYTNEAISVRLIKDKERTVHALTLCTD